MPRRASHASPTRPTSTRIVGMISGTSHDGIDVAVVDFVHDPERASLAATIVHHDTTPYDPTLRSRIVAALPPATTTMAETCALDNDIGRAFADVASDAIAAAGPPADGSRPVDLIVSHGQTMFHWVADPSPEPAADSTAASAAGGALGTLQLGQPAWIAERTGAPVLADIRSRDITAGGHGAPLVAILDGLVAGGMAGTAGLLNLGGIANFTVVEAGTVATAFDVGPSNALIDAVVADAASVDDPAVGQAGGALGYDEGGRIGAAGTVDAEILATLLDEPYYRLRPPKSTGKELFNLDHVRAALTRSSRSPSTPDLVATLVELTAHTVAAAAGDLGLETVVASGGGCHNPLLMDRLGSRLDAHGIKLTTIGDLGIPSDAKEALAFALIGWHTWHGLPATIPVATGATAPRLLGSIVPGEHPLDLPSPVRDPLRELHVSPRG